jgi:hypothetical protein
MMTTMTSGEPTYRPAILLVLAGAALAALPRILDRAVCGFANLTHSGD